MTRFEFYGFLKDLHIYDHAYSVEDLERDLAILRDLEQKGLLPRHDSRRGRYVSAQPLVQVECQDFRPLCLNEY